MFDQLQVRKEKLGDFKVPKFTVG